MLIRNIALGFSVLLLLIASWLIAGNDFGIGESAQSRASLTELLRRLDVEASDRPFAAPEFLLMDLTAKPFRLSDYRGKVVLLSFWATWCPSCRREMPSLEKLHAKLAARGLTMIGVSLREEMNEVEAFLRNNNLTFPILLDKDGRAAESYAVWALPTTFIIGTQGTILGKVVGVRDWEGDEAVDVFRKLLGENI